MLADAIRRASMPLVRAEFPLVLLVAPLLLFPRGPLPLVGLVAVLLLWLARLGAQKKLQSSTPLDLPILIILAMAAQAIYPSVDLGLSMPRLYGIVLGMAAYYAVVDTARTQRAWWLLVLGLMLATIAVALFGLVSTDWNANKFGDIFSFHRRIPQLFTSLQGSFGTIAGIHPNELAGTLAFLLPLPVALLLGTHKQASAAQFPPRRGIVGVAMATAVLAGLVLVLTYSRGAAFGLFWAMVALSVARWKPLGRLMTAGAFVVAIVVWLAGTQEFVDLAALVDRATSPDPSLLSRQEIWARALWMIHDFPFTGIGLNTFPLILSILYPSVTGGPDTRTFHAHDVYLQVTVDLGLAGLMAFVGLWLIIGRQVLLAYRFASDERQRAVILGLAAGFVAYLVTGLADSISLGLKPMPLLWGMFALVVAANRLDGKERKDRATSAGTRRWIREIGWSLWRSYWVVALLFVGVACLIDALSFLGWSP